MNASATTNTPELGSIIRAGGSHKFSWTIWILSLGTLALAIYGWIWWSNKEAASHRPPPFVTEPLKRGDIDLTVTATGNLEPTNQVTIGSELSGTTVEVYVDVNDRVTKGQPLVKIDIRRLNQQIDSSRAALASAKSKVLQVEATLKENQATLARLEELHRLSGGKTPSEASMVTGRAAVDRSKADLESSKAAVLQSEAELKANESDQNKSIIRSPIDGIVLTRSVEPGQTVAASFTAPELLILAEKLENMELKVAVAEADIGRVADGQKANFTVDAWPDRSFQAKVTRVSFGSVVTDNVVTYETELEVENNDLSLRPGMTATADIHVAESKNVLLVPTAALRFDPTAAAARSGPPGAGGGEKKSFVQSIMPGPPRRSSGGGGNRGPSGDNAGAGPSKKASPGHAQIWTLRNGQPVALPVKIGLTDGRFTEVSGEGLTEDMPIIVRASPPAA